MKYKFATTLLAIAFASTAHAQIADVTVPEQVLKGVHSNLFNPVLSADGTKLLFSDSDYSNLRIYDFNDNVTFTIDRDLRSGLDAQFTPDGKSVVYVAQNVGDNGLNMRQIRSYDVAHQNVTTLSTPARRIERPVVGNSGVLAAINGTATRISKTPEVGVRTSGSQLFITVGGKETAYTPVDSYAGYLWASVSPDGRKVMFVAAETGTYITDLKGNILAHLGKYEAPVWYDNDNVVAMKTTDDGHQLRSAQIVLLKADGSAVQELTRPESLTMNPTVSSQAGKIIYNTIDGRLFQMHISIK